MNFSFRFNTDRFFAFCKKSAGLWIFLFFSAITVYAIPLFRFRNGFLTRDWALFNSMSYFVKSSWLHYKTIPLHNPYILGGMDLFANPQSKVFSPLAIYDIVFTAPYANLFSLFTLSIVGGYGMFKLLRYLNVGYFISFLSTFIFMHASWFSLHFSAGHVIFGSFQLMALVLYFTIRIYEAKFKVYLAALLAFMILDGGMYAFIYSTALVLFSILFHVNRLSFVELFDNIKKQWKTTLFALFIFFGLSMAKIIPLLAVHGKRSPNIENIVLDGKSLLFTFFYPFQYNMLKIPGAAFHDYDIGFAELGAYFGIISFVILLVYLIKHFQRQYLPYLMLILLFFWIGSGFGHYINPWVIFQHLPIINNAHIQTRALFLAWFIALVLLSFAFDYYQSKLNKIWVYGFTIFFVFESLLMPNYCYDAIFKAEDSYANSDFFNSFITNTTVEKTIASPGDWGQHYQIYSKLNTASRDFMDPAINRGDISVITDKNYKGEIYFLSGSGQVEMLSYTPKSLIINISTNDSAEIQINTNYLLNWKSDINSIETFDKNGLLTIKTKGYQGIVTLKYRPWYLYLIMPLFSLSLISLFVFVLKSKSRLIT
jgi:hypothetical protein